MKGRITTLIIGWLLSAACWVAISAWPAGQSGQAVPTGEVKEVRSLRQPAVAAQLSSQPAPLRVNPSRTCRTAPQWGSGGSRLSETMTCLEQAHRLRFTFYHGKERLGAMPFHCHVSRDYYIIALRRILR